MKQRNLKTGLVAVALGSLAGILVWVFFRLFSIGIEFFWGYLPGIFDVAFFPLVLCTIGGIIIGICQKIFGPYPKDMASVMEESKKSGGYDPKKIPGISINALLPLVFGGSIGPEAGLVGVIVGFWTWIGNILDKISAIKLNKKKRKNFLALAAIFGVVVCYLLMEVLGGAMHIARFDDAVLTLTELIWFVPIVLIAAMAGYIFVFSEKLTKSAFQKLNMPILSAVIGGIILGATGMFLPLIMFSGEAEMFVLIDEWTQMSGWLLLVIGFVKLILINICISSGWRGGHIFPVIFAGTSIGFGLAAFFGTDAVFTAAVVTSTLCAISMRQPLVASAVLLICYPFWSLLFIVPAAFIGSWLPVPKDEKSAKAEVTAVSGS